MLTLVSAIPIAIVIIGIGILAKPSKIIGPISCIAAILLAGLYFKTPLADIGTNAYAGAKSAVQAMFMVTMAITTLNLLKETGAMQTIINALAIVSNDKRIQVIMVGMGFGSFLEGAAGAGAPAAIAGPFLVSLGINPLSAVAAALTANGITPCFGSGGMNAAVSASMIEDISSITYLQITAAAGMVLSVCCLVVPSVMIYIVFGKNGFKGLKKFLVFISAVSGGSYFIISYFIGPELIAMGIGVMIILGCIAWAKFFAPPTPEEFVFRMEDVQGKAPEGKAAVMWRALIIYIIIFITLPVVRPRVPSEVMNTMGHPTFVGLVIFIAMVIGAVALGVLDQVPGFLWRTVKSMVPPIIAMVTMVAMAKICQGSGMLKNIASSLSHVGPVLYPAAAMVIGTIGSFATGSAYSSIIMFTRVNYETAAMLGINGCFTVAGQNAGAALGNMICPHNVVSASTTVGMLGKEGLIIRKTIASWLLLAVAAGCMILLYTQVICPGFGIS
ncbi:L-lactate permease [Lachnospiraceae bacterium 62-35]